MSKQAAANRNGHIKKLNIKVSFFFFYYFAVPIYMNCDDIFMTISNICAVFEDEVDVAQRLDDHCFFFVYLRI